MAAVLEQRDISPDPVLGDDITHWTCYAINGDEDHSLCGLNIANFPWATDERVNCPECIARGGEDTE